MSSRTGLAVATILLCLCGAAGVTSGTFDDAHRQLLLHLIDATGADPPGDYRVIERELAAYGGGLEAKPRIVVLNKSDALAAGEADELVTLLRGEGVPVVSAISAVTGHGVPAVLRALRAEIDRTRASERNTLEEPVSWTP